jgi:hypothetical protein
LINARPRRCQQAPPQKRQRLHLPRGRHQRKPDEHRGGRGDEHRARQQIATRARCPPRQSVALMSPQ